MRVWSFLAFLSLVSCSQVSMSSQPTAASSTLVDALSADPDYTSLLRLLQSARLIPTLNKLNGSTLFAPTNDAIKRRSNTLWLAVIEGNRHVLEDNVREKLRQELFYHLLNYSLPLPLPTEPNLWVHKTLLFPRTPVESPSHEPPPSPPWMPIPGGTLGGEPQRLRVTARDGDAWVGVDAFGKGGAKVIKGQVDAGNGILFGIADVLEVPSDLAHTVSQHPATSYFHKILTPEITKLLNTTPNTTLFLPVNTAWENLDPLEKLYLESDFATDDLNRILNMHAVVEKHVEWSDTFEPAVNLTTIDGTTLKIIVNPESGNTTVSSAKLVQPDIFASNGVLHLVDSLLVPPGALQLTPEKYLLALNCTSFVSLLHSVDLTWFINDTEARYTILAPKDDVLAVWKDGELPERGTEELKKLLQYHFIPGRWTPTKMVDGMLLETALEEDGLDGGKQVISVDVSSNNEKKKTVEPNVRFGGAGVIGEHIEVDNAVIYFVSRPLIPPFDSLQTALPSLDLSSFLAAIFSTSLAHMLKTTPRTTLLIPHNIAFKRLGMLVSSHLLAASSKTDLSNVILHHVIDGVEYAQPLQNGSQHTFGTLEGSDLQIERSSNGTVLVSASGGWPRMKSELYPRNLLTQTGVVHELSDVMMPRSVELTVGKLVKAAAGTTMASMVNKVGLDWILNGTAPPEGSPWADMDLTGVGWTLLCPPDDAFKKYNLTKLYGNLDSVRAIVMQHLIPTPLAIGSTAFDVLDVVNNNRPISLDNSVTYSTLLSSSSAFGDIVFKQLEDTDTYIVGIKGARGTEAREDWARVLSWGRSTTKGGTGGVIQVDRLLLPYQPPWWVAYAPLGVGAIGVALICLFFYVVRLIWMKDTMEATYEPVGGFGRDDES